MRSPQHSEAPEPSSNQDDSGDSISRVHHPKSADILCIVLLLIVTLGVYAPSLFGGRVLLPSDIVPLMRPWGVHAREKFPDYHHAHNQMHGPIFEYYSWRHYARERIRHGEVPLWNPNELGGNVLLANSQSAVLYPPNALLYLFPLHIGINLVTAFHTFVTGVLLFLLMRLWRAGPAAAITSALVWMFCGVQMAWLEFQTPTAVLCWLPALLLAWEAYARGRGTIIAVAGGAAGVALTLLAGHLHFAFYVLLAFGMYAVWRSVLPALLARRFAQAARTLALLGAAIALGVMVSAATMLPVVEMARMNFREGKTEYASSIGLRLPPANLLTLLQPNVYGSPRHYIRVDPEGRASDGHNYFGAFDYIEYSCYLGIPGLALGLFGAAGAFRRRGPPTDPGARFFAILAAIGLLLALGTPLCALFFYGVPGYGQFNATARALCLFCFGMSALAGFGLQRLLSDPDTEAKRFWIVIGVLAVAGIAAFPGMALVHRKLLDDHWLPYQSSNLRHFAIFAGLTALAGWMLLRSGSSNLQNRARWMAPAIAAGDLLLIYGGFNPQTDPAMLGYGTDTTDYLQQAAPARVVSLKKPDQGIKGFIVPNYNAVYGLREVQGADSLHSKRFHKLMERVVMAMDPARGAPFTDPNTIHVPSVAHPVFDLLNVRFVTTVPDAPNPDPSRLRRVEQAELDIWENRRAIGPAWIVGSSEQFGGLDGFLARLADPTFNARANALVNGPSFALDPAVTGSPVRLTAFSAHRLELEVEPRGKGLLVLSEVAFPGWKAKVDGREAPVLTADYMLRAVPVSPDSKRVEFRYMPASFRVGLYLTCLSTGVLFGLFFVLRRGRRQPILGVPLT